MRCRLALSRRAVTSHDVIQKIKSFKEIAIDPFYDVDVTHQFIKPPGYRFRTTNQI